MSVESSSRSVELAHLHEKNSIAEGSILSALNAHKLYLSSLIEKIPVGKQI